MEKKTSMDLAYYRLERARYLIELVEEYLKNAK